MSRKNSSRFVKILRAFFNGKIVDLDDTAYKNYFDLDFYAATYPEDIEASRNLRGGLVEFFIKNGGVKLRNPNSYFDMDFYLSQFPEGLGDVEPLFHYVHHGWKQGVSPNWYFDLKWYLSENEDVRVSGVEPIRHFLEYGQFEGRGVHPKFASSYFLGLQKGENESGALSFFELPRGPVRDFALSDTPLISVIVTNMNGYEHLRFLFDSLDLQTYRNFEVIFVDDASTDDSVHYAVSRGAKVVRLDVCVGFAQANNEGLLRSKGELIALLNNDMRVDANWLEAMVATLKADSGIGAVAPLIRFWSKFQRVEMTAASSFELEVDALRASLSYKKYFVREGGETNETIQCDSKGVEHRIVIDLPLQPIPIKLAFKAKTGLIVSLKAESAGERFAIVEGASPASYLFSPAALKGGFFVINNAGSFEIEKGQPADRAFGDIDKGQYTTPEPVAFLCGGAALIRRDALFGRQLFIGKLVAYYEDGELSLRLRRDGFKIVFDPKAIVYHRHSASNVEKSAFWRKHTFRNKWIFAYLYWTKRQERLDINHRARMDLNHLRNWYASQSNLTPGEAGFLKETAAIDTELTELFGLIDGGEAVKKSGLRIGVFNPFWSTLSDGEAHALQIAKALTSFGQVEFISENDFDFDLLCNFFDSNGLEARKRIVLRMTSELSGEYDIFVNSAFRNTMPSKAKLSYSILNILGKTPSSEFLQSYRFLANSHYTLDWMKRLWGEGTFKGEILYPSVADELFAAPDAAIQKSRTILNVRGFAANGHEESQKEIARAFLQLVEEEKQLTDGWQLVLLGDSKDEKFVNEASSLARGSNIRVILDATHTVIAHQYALSAIYVDASGFGRSPKQEPELFECFGMAIAEAAANGCIPIAYNAAGPKEIVDAIGEGAVYSTLDELKDILRSLIVSENRGELIELHGRIAAKANQFSRKTQQTRLIEMFEADLEAVSKQPITVEEDSSILFGTRPEGSIPVEEGSTERIVD